MKIGEALTPKQIKAATEFYKRHWFHIDGLVEKVDMAYPPTLSEDKGNPMIWKDAHWKWFLKHIAL